MQRNDILLGDALAVLHTLPSECVQTVVTSPPYYSLRDYGSPPIVWGGRSTCQHEWVTERYYREGGNSISSKLAFSAPGPDNAQRIKDTRWRENTLCQSCDAWLGSLGLEPTPELYVEHIVQIFRQVRRVLRNDGTVWLNLGDTYYSGRGKPHGKDTKSSSRSMMRGQLRAVDRPGWKLPHKSLIGIPWRVALALQDDGWTLRSEVIWYRENAMPEASANDRPHRKHEKLFVFTRSERYTFNRAALGGDEDVWRIPIVPGNGDHSATFPVALVDRCIAAGSAIGDIVLDPFMGLGTTGCAAKRLERQWLGIELNPTYRMKALRRIERFALAHPFFEMDA